MRLTIAWLAQFAAAWTALSDTIRLAPSADTTLFESAPDFSMGGEWHVASGTTGTMGSITRNRGLFKFALDPIPRGATVKSVALVLRVVGVPGRDGGGSSANSLFALHRVERDWGEGNKLSFRGELAEKGEATWNHRLAPDSGGHGGFAWSVPGASAPEDFAAASSATLMISGTNRYTFGSTPSMVADVQKWLEDPGTNQGWILISQSESQPKTARRFASREDTTNAPVLVIEYVPPDLPRFAGIERVGGRIQLAFPAKSGQSYRIQYCDSLTLSTWLSLTNIAAQSTASTPLVTDTLTPGSKFYRISQP